MSQSLELGFLASTAAITMPSAVLTSIDDDIGPNAAYAWMTTSQVVAVAIFSPLAGRLSDIFGRRNFILFGGLLGMIGSIISATAHRVEVVIGGGIFLGTASAFQQLVWAGIGEIIPRKYRGMVTALIEACVFPAGAFGPIIANSIVATTTWRWIYWIIFIIATVSVALVFLFYRPRNQYIREEGKTTLEEVWDLDWIGFPLYAGGLLLFLLGITFGGNQLAWKSAGTICMIIIGAVLLVAFGLFEAYYDQIFPLFPPAIMRKVRGFAVVLVGTFLFGTLYYSTAVLWPVQIEALYTQNLIDVGWYASTLGIAGMIFGPIIGFVFTYFGHARILYTFAVGLATIAAGCMAIVTPDSRIASSVLVGIMGVSISWGMAIAGAMCQLAVSHEYLGLAANLAVTMRNIGGAVGTVIYMSIFSNRFKSNMMIDVAMPLLKSGVPPASITSVIAALTKKTPESILTTLKPEQFVIGVNGIKDAYVHALRVVYLVSIAFGVLATICAAFTMDVDHLLTNEIDIILDEGAMVTQGLTDTGEGHVIYREEQEAHHHRTPHKDSAQDKGVQVRHY
ncbi:trichothecene efflux pump [Lepidopterella palustris CBS 459.81]|uniref:Trichothecene efflux pump n=1 Tax=Lepidopterella palustris CBS 459.81 TaxID=1314670 RepID=A0A8E2DWS0_9PEZI|nr:trichothecene efflux pump [Lepidopterella palustris CBS 459.81]